LDTPLTPEQREWVETIRSSGDLLLAIINDILDFSKIEAGHLELETIDFDIRQTVESAIELFAEQAQARGLELVDIVDDDIPVIIRGDPSRLRQVILNFVSNGLKFTETGEVVVRVSLDEDRGADGVVLRLAVTDTGIGISDDAMTRLFRPFSQADGTMARKYGGTGLGLAISRQLAEMMGGAVGVTSEVGTGSTFWFTGCFEVPAGAHHRPPPAAALRGASVLVVDDNATQRAILRARLGSWGLEVTAVGTASEALDALRIAATGGVPISLAVIDETMPVTDGFALARLIKADDLLARIPIVLLAAPGRRGQLQGRTVAAGIATYLRKPVRLGELHDVLARLVAPGMEVVTTPGWSSDEAAERVTFPGARVLVAEDNPVNARLASTQLAKLGCVVDSAGDGVEALEAIARAHYDIVLMDCQMPEIDGFEATRRLRAREAAGDQPRVLVIAMTANAMAGDRERCLEAGMDDYLAKPVALEDLRSLLGRYLGPGRLALAAPAVLGRDVTTGTVFDGPGKSPATGDARP
ncbi:MAG: response regulator, partial [Vicinamibacterales bacterium]